MVDFSKLPLWVTQRVIQAQLRECDDSDKERARKELGGILCRPVSAGDLAFFGLMNISKARCVIFLIHRDEGRQRHYAVETWRADREEVRDDARVEGKI